jgi:SAM-dependent methyltransferase
VDLFMTAALTPTASAPTDNPPPLNLFGDRHIEWSWLAAHLPHGPGRLLDFGSADSWIAMVAVHRGYRVTCVDLESHERPYVEPQLQTIVGDLFTVDLPDAAFDVVFNCSAVEHVGLSGRYTIDKDDAEGDLQAMSRMRCLLKPGGVMILTVPVGLDAVFGHLCRVYGQQRLPRLLAGFEIVQQAFWIKKAQNKWQRVQRDEALQFPCDVRSDDFRRNLHGLGCFVLRKPEGGAL